MTITTTPLTGLAGVQQRISTIAARLGVADRAPLVRADGGAGSFAASLDAAASVPATVPTAPADVAPTVATRAVATHRPERAAAAAPTLPGATATLAGGAGADAVVPGTPYAAELEAAGRRHGVPPGILAAVAHVESRFRPDVVSPAGAVGLMQLMPDTARGLGVDPTDPVASIDGAARLLRSLQDRFGSLELALGAYNVGPGTISRAGGIAPGSQAERYVRAVLDAAGVDT